MPGRSPRLLASSAVAKRPPFASAARIAATRPFSAGWETRDWDPLGAMLADDFTFLSANNDDHISKTTFKRLRGGPNIDFIKDYDLEQVIGTGDTCFVKHLCHTKNSKLFRSVEFLPLKTGRSSR